MSAKNKTHQPSCLYIHQNSAKLQHIAGELNGVDRICCEEISGTVQRLYTQKESTSLTAIKNGFSISNDNNQNVAGEK